MPFPQITDVPLSDRERLVVARCVHMTRELMTAMEHDPGLVDELTVLKARLLGPDLKLDCEAAL